MLLILTEKPSAAANFAKAFGGKSGTYNGQSYKIVNSYGHILEFKEPHEMVPDDEADLFRGWEPGLMPWDISKMSWQKKFMYLGKLFLVGRILKVYRMSQV